MVGLESVLLVKFSRFGVLHREEVKNNLTALKKLIRSGFVRKVYKRGKVFYELTEKGLPLLDLQRRKMLEEAKLRSLLERRTQFYKSLTEDLRFFDEKRPEAREFLFLGDWQLNRPVVSSQLELSKLRFYRERRLA